MKTIFILLLFPLALTAQDVTGVWTGFIYSGETKLPYEVVISKQNGDLAGFALTVFTIDGVKNVGLKSLKLKEKKGKLLIEDDELLYNNYTTAARRRKLVTTLSLSVKKNVSSLSGPFSTRAIDFRERDKPDYSGTIELQKQSLDSSSNIVGVLSELDLLPQLSFMTESKPATAATANPVNPVASLTIENERPTLLPSVSVRNLPTRQFAARQINIVREVVFDSDSLVLTLFDNGEVDGDTVSVLLNGKILMNRKGLTAQPFKQTVYLTPDIGDSILIVMYAENLGVFPPNTGMLILQEGDKRYNIRFTGDFQKNSAIMLRRKK